MSATHSPRTGRDGGRRTAQLRTIMDMIMIMMNRTRKKMTSWVIDI